MKLKDRLWEVCEHCGSNVKVIQDESFGCDNCKKPIDDLLRPKQIKYAEHLELTVFWGDGSEATHFQICSWICLF